MVIRLATVGLLAMAVARCSQTGGVATNDNVATERGAPPAPRSTAIPINRALADRLRADVDMLTSGATWSPVITDRRLRGFTLREIEPDSLLEAFGFRQGDVVEWSDSQPVDWDDDHIRFRVRRGDRVFDIVLLVSVT